MNRLHYISSRITVVMATMGLLTAIAIGIGAYVFHAVGGQVRTVNSDRIPEVAVSTNLILATTGLNEMLNRITNAADIDALQALEAGIKERSNGVRELIAALDATNNVVLGQMIDETESALNSLTMARRAEFKNRAEIAASLREMADLKTSVATNLNGLIDDAHFNLVIEGESAIMSVSEVLTKLLERDFQTLRLAQQIRAEANLLSGLAISIGRTSDAALVSILEDLATGSVERYQNDLETLRGLTDDTESLAALAAGATYFARAFEEHSPSKGQSNEPLAVRQSVDSALSILIDDLEFNLTIEAETAKETNSATIQSLLDNQVSQILSTASLENAMTPPARPLGST